MSATRVAFWLLYWGVSFCVWLLFVNTTHVHELWMAAASAVITATATEIVRAQPFASFRPRVGWVLEAWREPWYVLQACGIVFWVFLKRAFHHDRSVLREVVFDPGASDPASAARRALAIAYTTVSPNDVVLGIDLDKNVMLVHQLSEAETSTMTRSLGAKS